MEEDVTGQFWPGSNIEVEGTGHTGQYWPGSNIEEEDTGQTGQNWPVAPLGWVGEPERLEIWT